MAGLLAKYDKCWHGSMLGLIQDFEGYHSAYFNELKLTTASHLQHRVQESSVFSKCLIMRSKKNKTFVIIWEKKTIFILNCSLTAALLIQRQGHN